jgi:hypothetical protein
MANTLSWKVNTETIKNYKRGVWDDDVFKESLDGKYGIYMYAIIEATMGAYYTQIALYNDKTNSTSILNSSNVWVWFNWVNSFGYAVLSDCLIFRISAYNADDPKGKNMPYLLIKPEEKKFSFIPWDYSSIYYGFEELQKNVLSLTALYMDEIARIKGEGRLNEIFDIGNMTWYDFADFDDAPGIYQKIIA